MLRPITPRQWSPDLAAHLLRRTVLGASPADIERIHALGPRGAVEFVLSGSEDFDLFPPPEEVADTSSLSGLRKAVRDSRGDPEAREKAQRELRRAEGRAVVALRGWWIRRMRYSTHPLRETMALFWHGHFTSSILKVRATHDMWLQNEVFRRHGLGDFRELAREIPSDPAMMQYLDIFGSEKSRPNENFARELMELFLLGEGRYSEQDIREAARAFTGYRINPLTREVIFQDSRFDAEPKSLFGSLRATTPEDVVEILLSRPECAPYIAGKIWTFFAAVPASPSLLQVLGEKFRASGYDLSALLRTLFMSEEFFSHQARRCQIKSPVQWLVGSAKALECGLSGDINEQKALTDLGQTLFDPPNVKGWEGGRSWVSASTMLARGRLATELFVNSSENLRRPDPNKLANPEIRLSPEALCDELSQRMLHAPLPLAEKKHLAALVAREGQPVADDQIAEILKHLMNLPEYQLA